MQKLAFFMLFRVRIKKQVSEVQKSGTLTLENSICVKNLEIYFFQKMRAHPIGGDFFFGVLPKYARRRVLYIGHSQNLETGV